MSEPTYYTPSIEEFRVGFIFEFLDNKWKQVRITEDYPVSRIAYYYKTGVQNEFIRVKLLDHDDIVAEGWKRETTNQFSIGEFEDLKYYDLVFYENGTVDVDCYELQGRDSNRFEYSVPVSVRGIKILNRSELNFLMKRLGII